MVSCQIEYYTHGLSRFFFLFNREKRKGYNPVEFARELPQKWNELTKKQLLAIARAQLFKDPHVQQMHLAKHFLNIPFYALADMGEDNLQLINEEISKLLEVNLCTKIFIQSVITFSGKWIGPKDAGSNMVFVEWINADRYYANYVKTKETKWLNHLIATLYRPHDKHMSESHPLYAGDLRVKLNEFHIVNRAKHCRIIPMATRIAILLQYVGFRNWLEKKYPETFSEREKKKRVGGMNALMIDLAGTKMGATSDDVAYRPLHEVMIHLENSALLYNELDKK